LEKTKITLLQRKK